MKKVMTILVMAALGLGAFGETFVTKGYQPNSSDVVTATQDFADWATPVLIYTELADTTTNVVVLTFAPDLATNATDYAASYRLGTFTTVGGAEAPIVLNEPEDSNAITTGPVARDDAVVFTGDGGTDETNVLYRIVWRLE